MSSNEVLQELVNFTRGLVPTLTYQTGSVWGERDKIAAVLEKSPTVKTDV